MASTGQKSPRRMCIACRESGDKRELVRIVRSSAGGAEIDLTGKQPGRGAYVCLRPECWQVAVKKGRLDSALKTSLNAEARERLEAFAAGLNQAAAV